MQLLEKYEKDQVLKAILENFDCAIEEITHDELADFAYTKIKTLLKNSHNLVPSRCKKYSMYDVAIVFIYQELFFGGEQTFFDSCVESSVHKDNAPALIYVACNFANAYNTLEDETSISNLNKLVIEELLRLRDNEENNRYIVQVEEDLFKEKDTHFAQKHLLKTLQLQESFHTIKDSQEKKLLLKVDTITLMMLFRRYHDENTLARYTALKKMFKITLEEAISDTEIKQVVDTYRYSKSKKQIRVFNDFAMDVTRYIKNFYLIRIDDTYIESSFLEISARITKPKWYTRLWVKKDTKLLYKNTILIQQELYTFQKSYTKENLNTLMFKGDFKIFSSVAMLVQEYDVYFNTVSRLGNLVEADFTGYASAAGMNIKNYYESSNNPIVIEAINRFLWFWILLNEKSLQKKLGK